jgi:hypothetical protein
MNELGDRHEPSDEPSAEDNRRAYFRVDFPASSGPSFRAEGWRAVVLDCSSLGMRIRLDDDESGPPPGTPVAGRLRFAEGRSADVQGTVLRDGPRGLVIAFHEGQGVPLSFVLDEERLKMMRRKAQPGQGRSYFRFSYPRKVSPMLHAELWSAPVANCSESGLYCLAPVSGESPEEGAQLSGIIAFNEGRVLRFSGRILRASRGGFALELHAESGLPLSLVLAEERFVTSKFIQPFRD